MSPAPLYPLQSVLLASGAALLLGLLLGVWMSRRPRGQTEDRGRKMPGGELDAYRRGLDYLSEGKTDQAIREFSLAARINPENRDVYLRLGQLYRTRGEVERALRIHEGLTVRPDLPLGVKVKALLELACDCKALGHRERALAVLERAAALDSNNREVYQSMFDLYREAGDWKAAYEVEKKIYKMPGGGDVKVLSHLKIEEGKHCLDEDKVGEALRCFKTAIALDKKCVEARLLYGDALERQGKVEKAISAWEGVGDADPTFMFLAFERMEKAYFDLGRYAQMSGKYLDHLRSHPEDYHTRLALARLYEKKQMYEEAVGEFREILSRYPTLVEAYRTLHQTYLRERRFQEASEELTHMLEALADREEYFRCGRCGHQSRSVFWKCPQCGHWDSIELLNHQDAAAVRQLESRGG